MKHLINGLQERKNDMIKELGNLYSEDKYAKLVDCAINNGAITISSGLISFQMSLIPIMTGMAFNSEYKMVKREIAVNTYSVVSYYFSVLILEYLRYLPFFTIFMAGSKIILGSALSLTVILTYFLMFSTVIVAYLFYGSVLRGTKRVTLIYGLFIVLNTDSLCHVVAFMRKKKSISKMFIITYLLNLCPNYVLGANPAIHSLTKLVRDYSNLYDLKGKKIIDRWIISNREEHLKILKSLLINYEIPVICNYLLCVLLIALYMLLCIMMLSFHLRAGYRIKLNEK